MRFKTCRNRLALALSGYNPYSWEETGLGNGRRFRKMQYAAYFANPIEPVSTYSRLRSQGPIYRRFKKLIRISRLSTRGNRTRYGLFKVMYAPKEESK